MTDGLIWWHAVCEEVRANGRFCARRNKDPKDKKIELYIREAAFCLSTYRIPSHPLTPQAVEFLRAQWLTAYKKARTANNLSAIYQVEQL